MLLFACHLSPLAHAPAPAGPKRLNTVFKQQKMLGPTTQSSNDTRIADLTTAHHNFIPIKHRSYPNTVNYYLDSTNYRLTKTKTIKLTQRLAEFSCMLTFHSFQSEQCAAMLRLPRVQVRHRAELELLRSSLPLLLYRSRRHR